MNRVILLAVLLTILVSNVAAQDRYEFPIEDQIIDQIEAALQNGDAVNISDNVIINSPETGQPFTFNLTLEQQRQYVEDYEVDLTRFNDGQGLTGYRETVLRELIYPLIVFHRLVITTSRPAPATGILSPNYMADYFPELEDNAELAQFLSDHFFDVASEPQVRVGTTQVYYKYYGEILTPLRVDWSAGESYGIVYFQTEFGDGHAMVHHFAPWSANQMFSNNPLFSAMHMPEESLDPTVISWSLHSKIMDASQGQGMTALVSFNGDLVNPVYAVNSYQCSGDYEIDIDFDTTDEFIYLTARGRVETPSVQCV